MKLCEICGSNAATYVCSECGRSVCDQCFESDGWICSACLRAKEEYAGRGQESSLSSMPLFMKVFLAGFLLIFLGTAIIMIAGLMGWVSQSFGLVVFIGPIPIILGAGKYPFLAMLLAAILTIIGVVLFLILRKYYQDQLQEQMKPPHEI
jgi:uncharacterized membrane protein